MIKKLREIPVTVWFIFACILLQLVLKEEWKVYLAIDGGRIIGGQWAIIDLFRLISYQFLHEGWRHLMGNFMFGFPACLYVEKKLGKSQFLVQYLGCGAIGGLLFCLISSAIPMIGLLSLAGLPMYLMGSSGSIYGIMLYACILLMKEGNWKVGIGLLGILYCLPVQLYLTILSVSAPSEVAFGGHLGGMIGALVIGYFLRPE